MMDIKSISEWLDKTDLALLLSKPWFIPLATVVGGAIALWKWRSDKRYDRRNVELLNTSKFVFEKFCRCDELNGSSRSRCNTIDINPQECHNKDCRDIHWFNIRYDGKIAIKNFSVSLIDQRELKTADLLNIVEKRRLNRPHIAPDTTIQYKLSEDEIGKSKSKKIRFYVLVEYQSEYSKIKYKRIYCLYATNVADNNSEWPFNLNFYDYEEEAVAQNHWYYFIQKTNAYFRNVFSLRYSIGKNWLYDFWRKQ